jgi:hypothetical protein
MNYLNSLHQPLRCSVIRSSAKKCQENMWMAEIWDSWWESIIYHFTKEAYPTWENKTENYHFTSNEEPAWTLTQKVALMHNLVKNNECDVTYVLKEPRRRSKCVIHNKVWCCSVDVAVITELCISATYQISSSGSSFDDARLIDVLTTLGKVQCFPNMCLIQHSKMLCLNCQMITRSIKVPTGGTRHGLVSDDYNLQTA